MDSILISIKKLLGITEDYNHFDPDIIMHINSVLMVLGQLGVGPSEGFFIEDEYDTWDDFLGDSNVNLSAVKSYVYMKVRLLFDPPLSSIAVSSMERLTSELEWRLNIAADTKKTEIIVPDETPDNVPDNIPDETPEDTPESIYPINFAIDWKENSYISRDDGREKTEYGSVCTDFIELGECTYLHFTNTMTTNAVFNAFYDINKRFISSFSSLSGYLNVPTNAKYFRLSRPTNATVSVVGYERK